MNYDSFKHEYFKIKAASAYNVIVRNTVFSSLRIMQLPLWTLLEQWMQHL